MVRLLHSVNSVLLILALVFPLAAANPASAQVPATVTTPVVDQAQITKALRGTSLLFIENVGQFDSRARFQIRGGQGTTWLAEDALWITVIEPQTKSKLSSSHVPLEPSAMLNQPSLPRKGVNLRLSFEGANPAPQMVPFARSETKVSYFLGNDPSAWRPDVPVWDGVRYVDLYPGLDLEVTSVGGYWSWRMVAKGTASQRVTALAAVRLRVEGADTLTVAEGALHLDTAAGALVLPLLQIVDPQGTPVSLSQEGPRLSSGVVADPFGTLLEETSAVQAGGLVYSTFLGGNGGDSGYSIDVDESGQAYVTGETPSANYPTTVGTLDTIYNGGGTDAFVSLLNSTGTTLIYSTFLGGSGRDRGCDIAVDESGQTYVTGSTTSSDYPTTSGAFDTTYNGNGDAFVSVLNYTGTALVYSTFLGGSNSDSASGIAVDEEEQAYITGDTNSSDYITTTLAIDTTFNGGLYDAYVSVLNSTGTSLVYSTFLGGDDYDIGDDIAVDGTGQAYVTGFTFSSNYPTTTLAFDTTFNGGNGDAFVTVLNSTGTTLVYSTFLGGASQENGNSIAVDGSGQAYVTGMTFSSDYPTSSGAFDTTVNGNTFWAFVSVLNITGTALVYSTFLGGNSYDMSVGRSSYTQGSDIAVDGEGRAYVTGETRASDFPTTPGAFDTTYNGINIPFEHNDGFVTVFNPTGTALVYSTYLGAEYSDWGNGIAVDGTGSIYVTGYTSSSNYPTTPGAFDTTFNGASDAFVSVLRLPFQVALPLVQR